MLKLLINNINGKVYQDIKSIYSITTSSILLDKYMTDLFSCDSTVKQGDILSTTLFNICK